MNADVFFEEFRKIVEEAYNVASAKNEDYSNNDDALAGFKKIAKDLNISPFQAWAVFASKHWQALTSFAAKGKVESEPIKSRIIDMINYSILLHLLILDNKESLYKLSEDAKSLSFKNNTSCSNNIDTYLTNEEKATLDSIKNNIHFTNDLLKEYFNL